MCNQEKKLDFFGILYIKATFVQTTLKKKQNTRIYDHNMMDFPQRFYAAIEFLPDWDACDRIPMKASGEESTHSLLPTRTAALNRTEKTRAQKPATLQTASLQKVVLTQQDLLSVVSSV